VSDAFVVQVIALLAELWRNLGDEGVMKAA